MRKKYRIIFVFLIIVFMSISFLCIASFAQNKVLDKSLNGGNTGVAVKGVFKSEESNHNNRFNALDQNMSMKSKLEFSLWIIITGYICIFLLVNIVNRTVKDVKTRHIVRKNINYFFNILIIILLVLVWIQNMNHITVFLSVLGAGLALALQEAILCIAGWLLIIVRRPFNSGDRIELGGIKGDVIDIRLFQTSLLEIGNWVHSDQSTGRIANIPNSAVFKKENFNYNQGFEFIWNEISVVVTFESDWKKAEEIMLEHGNVVASDKEDIAKQKISFMTRKYMIKYGKLAPIVYVDIKDNGVELTLRYLTEARKRRTTQDQICRSILSDFEKLGNVNFAYTTYRIVK